jgi:U3 small nucleolar RNA-associated protein 20
MVSYLNVDSLERYLVHILTPVYRITEDDTVRDSNMGEFFRPQATTVSAHIEDQMKSKQ